MPVTPSTFTPTATMQGRVESTRPLWFDDKTLRLAEYPPLRSSRSVEACVVGAGIAGLSVAYALARAGREVLVIDERGIAAGESGQTSAHLASAQDDRFINLERTLGKEGAAISYHSHAAAIDSIEEIAEREKIDCDFQRLDGYLFLGEGQSEQLLQEEMAAAQRAGFVDVTRLDRAPAAGFESGPCLRFPRQARFHPLKYLLGLARAIESHGGRFAVGNRVRDISSKDGKVHLETAQGFSVTAKLAVAATNVPNPINNWLGIYTKQSAYRTYITGFEIDPASLGDALYWDAEDPYHYVRVATKSDGKATLIAGGEDHRVGHSDDGEERFKRLETWTRARFKAGAVTHRWSGQVNEPADGLGFIGKVPTGEHENCYVVTGDSGMGLTLGALAGLLILDLVNGNQTPWTKLYDPSRKTTSLRGVGQLLVDNASNAAHYGDYVTRVGPAKDEETLAKGCGAVIKRNGERIAAYRDDAGNLHECSAVCTHLKGILAWNSVERSWDCPVHGSRFDVDGKMLTGPAIDDQPPAKPAPPSKS